MSDATARLAKLRELMKERAVDAVLVPTDDFHGSEYVGDYFRCRKFLTGFTGSAGTAVILHDQAGLWTDGRDFLQAAQQLEGNHERQAFEHSCQNDHPADAQGKVPEAFPEDAVLIQASEIADNVIPLINIGKNGTLGARFKHLA